MQYIERHGEVELVWKYRIVQHGFDTFLFCRGTESEVREYIESEYPHDRGSHRAVTEEELAMIEALKLTVYIAPKL